MAMLRKTLSTLMLLTGVSLPVWAAAPGNMIGRQSQNEGILVIPAPAEVGIDGRLDDWDLSGRIWVFADKNVRNRYSAEVAAMWTATDLYLAVQWKDPTPMYSMVDPDFNAGSGWKSDALQLRVWTPDQTSWLTMWHFAGKNQPVLHVAKWKDPKNSRTGQDVTLLAAKPNSTILGQGAEMAYRQADDGKGYVQEIRIPWTLVYKQPPEMKAGVVFRLGMEFLWGDPTGKTWPIHRYADNMQPGHTSREFFWTAWRAWGNATLHPEGNVPRRKYVQAGSKLEGTLPIRVTLPKDAVSFTVVIEDADGTIIRSMGGLDPNDYAVETKGDQVTVEVLWDGLTDKVWSGDHRTGFAGQGKLVPPGTYKVLGLHHHGLFAEYEMCFYNPGTPPWNVSNGSGGWGADHAHPLCVTRAGDRMIISWPFAEGGHGIIGVGADGLKQWGEKRGGVCIAGDDKHVYAVPAGWHLKKEAIIRLDNKTGSYAPFVLDDEPRTFELPLATILEGKMEGSIKAIAVHDQTLAMALVGDESAVALLEKDSAQLKELLPTPALSALAFRPNGDLYGLTETAVVRIDLGDGAITKQKTPGLAKPVALALDRDNHFVVADLGPDNQVKAYDGDGKLVYTCGKKGGRPIRGNFDPQAMMQMSSVAVDARGHIWVVENWSYPRRVSVWGRDGNLIVDYIGNTGYAGTGCFLHDQDPTLGYVGPIEVKLDQDNRKWEVTRILWVPDKSKGESFEIPINSHVTPQRFRSKVSGQMREYFYVHDPRGGVGNVVLMERNGKWQPVAAVCLAGHIAGDFSHHGIITKQPDGELAGLNAYDGIFWNDTNKDGKVQRAECEVVKTDHPGELNAKDHQRRGRPAIALNNGWGGRIGHDLTFYVDGVHRVKPVKFTGDGAPIYQSKGMQPVGVDEQGDLVPVPEEDLLLCLSRKGYAGPTRMAGIDTKAGAVRWTYPNPYPGVHGSHRATMPEPGLLIGPLKILGVVHANDDAGRVFALRGNLGQDFFMTTDGLFVGTMFEDGRLPGMPLPNEEEQLVGMPMEAFSNGGEPFNGCLMKHDDGNIRMITGFPRQAAMVLRVNGLETVKRFAAGAVTPDAETLAKVDADNQRRAAAQAAAGAAQYVIKKLTDAPQMDGSTCDWQSIPKLDIRRAGSPQAGTARLAYDKENLYVLFEVSDTTTWMNQGKEFSRLFKTGDAVDVQLSPSGNQTRNPKPGDFRIVLSQLNRKPIAVLMQPHSQAGATAPRTYTSPVAPRSFDRVEIIKDATVKVTTKPGDSYIVEAAIPLAAIDLEPKGTLTGDLGFISSNADGTVNTARTYWSNKQTNLVNDEPSESWLYPNEWGTLTFE